MKEFVFNVDFDGTCVTHDFPKIGKDIGAQRVLKRIVESGHKLILFTMRSDRQEKKDTETLGIENVTGAFLTEAVEWFKSNDIPLYGIQNNPTQHHWTTSPKSYAHFMIDDSAIGCPLDFDLEASNKPFVNWRAVEYILERQGLLTPVILEL